MWRMPGVHTKNTHSSSDLTSWNAQRGTNPHEHVYVQKAIGKSIRKEAAHTIHTIVQWLFGFSFFSLPFSRCDWFWFFARTLSLCVYVYASLMLFLYLYIDTAYAMSLAHCIAQAHPTSSDIDALDRKRWNWMKLHEKQLISSCELDRMRSMYCTIFEQFLETLEEKFVSICESSNI